MPYCYYDKTSYRPMIEEAVKAEVDHQVSNKILHQDIIPTNMLESLQLLNYISSDKKVNDKRRSVSAPREKSIEK